MMYFPNIAGFYYQAHLAAVDGRLDIESPPGGGTLVRWLVAGTKGVPHTTHRRSSAGTSTRRSRSGSQPDRTRSGRPPRRHWARLR